VEFLCFHEIGKFSWFRENAGKRESGSPFAEVLAFWASRGRGFPLLAGLEDSLVVLLFVAGNDHHL
jgi:hypothetical protein